ncbi:MAG: FAD-binding protein [Clostridiales bacterium]|nr:FAD-binding protein [Clostridiales bacterium]
MSKNLSRREFLRGATAGTVSLAATGMMGIGTVALAEEATAEAIYTPGTYTATSLGIGEVTVTMTFDETSITDVLVDVSNETETIGQLHGETLQEALLAAQSAGIDGVSGATVTSDAVKEAAANCIAQAMGVSVSESTSESTESESSWKDAPEAVDESEITRVYDVEVGVIGLGHSGLPLTRILAENGVSVLTVESMTSDAWTVYGEDIGHINSEILAGFGVPEVDPIEFYNNFMVMTHGKANPHMVMEFAKYSGEAIDWYLDPVSQEIMDSAHVAFWPDNENTIYQLSNGYRYYAGTLQLAESNWLTEEEQAEREHVYSLQDAIIEIKDYVLDSLSDYATVLFGTKGSYLLQSEDGSVTGFVAKDDDGYIQVNCSKGVVLAGGGFGGNEEMCKDLLPYVYALCAEDENVTSFMDRDGTAIQMGYWAGARMEAEIPTMNYDSNFGPTVFSALWLNKDGKRFMNEAIAGQEITGFSMARRFRGKMCAIFDNTLETQVLTGPPAHGWIDYANSVKVESTLATFEAAYGKGAEGYDSGGNAGGSMYYAADTLDELADYLGYEGDAKEQFLATIEEYNAMCDAGADTEYGKDPHFLFPVREAPFYAVLSSSSLGIPMVTTGGLITNDEYQVLDKAYEPIPGLYAAGNCCGLRWGPAYVTPVAGMSIGMAITLSYVLGKELSGQEL